MNRENLISHLRGLPAERRIITALDVPGQQPALDLARRLGTGGGFVKVGLELFSAAGPEVVAQLRDMDRNIFLDLKYHDIPNTVASAARRAAAMGASLCTMHAQAGRGAMTAAAEALATAEVPDGAVRPALLAVTVLTSLSEEEIQEVRPSGDNLDEAVVREQNLYARLAVELVFRSPQVCQLEHKGDHMLSRLFQALVDNYLGDGKPRLALLSGDFEKEMGGAEAEQARARIICDYLAGMTDGFASRIYKRMFDPDFGSIVDLV